MPIGLLLAMQASGMVIDWLGTQNQLALSRMGQKLDQAALNANLEMTRLQSTEQSVDSMKKLRQNLGSQAALMAARGTRSGVGTSLSFMTESVGNFNADERTRKLNLAARENELKAGGLISSLHDMSSRSQIGQAFIKRTANTFGSSQFQNAFNGSFGLSRVKQ